MDKDTKGLLILGVSILALGLVLLGYSISSYLETKELANKIDFNELENNNQMPDNDKYFQYLSNADFLNQKLKQNKNLIIKNSSCIYLDYAKHNAIGLYKLVQNQSEFTRQNVAKGNIKTIESVIENYKSCKNYKANKESLKRILDNDDRVNELYEQDRINNFINGDIYVDNQLNEEQVPQTNNTVNIPQEPYQSPSASDTLQTGGTY